MRRIGHKLADVKRHLALGSKWLAGAGGLSVLSYLVATEAAKGKHPFWPYWLFAGIMAASLAVYLACQERTGQSAAGSIGPQSSEVAGIVLPPTGKFPPETSSQVLDIRERPRTGGEADKFGKWFEGRWTVRHMLDVLAGTAELMVIEETGESGEGIEFSVVRPSGAVEAHQVKRQSGNSNSWSIATLVGLGVIKAAAAQIALGREFHFVSVVPSRKLQELADRSRRVDSIEVFCLGLTEGLRPEFETFAAAIGAEPEAFTVLRSFHLRVIDELELRNTNEAFARLLAICGGSASAAAAVLAEIALGNLGRTFDRQFLREELKRYGLNATDVAHAPTLAATLRDAEGIRLVRLSPISDQLAKVREIAPRDGLQEREDETIALAQFCEGGDPYLRVAGAPWAGKTALLASFALDPPDGIDVLSFFVNGRTATDADSSAFTDALLSQLADLLGESAALPSEPRERDAYRRQLLSQGADRAHAEGRRLLLVVDGLDEDWSRGSARGQPSIASLLPAGRRPGLRILVAARAGYELPLDVGDSHPLRRCLELDITPSPSAELRRAAAEQELHDLLAHNDRRELLAVLAASGGGLARDDLAVLTGLSPFSISEAFTGIAARTVVRSPSGAYAFAHEQLLAAAKSAFGTAVLEQRRSRIEEWANGYQESGWPVGTPGYLLTSYGLLLAEAVRTPQMISLATDSRRHERMIDLVGGHTSALREIDAAGQLLVGRTPDDVQSALWLAIERQDVGTGHRVPFSVMITWAVVGRTGRAEAFARSAGSPREVMRALVALAVALTRYGNPVLAERILGTATDAAWADAALAKMAREAARSGDVSRAAHFAGRVVHRPYAERAFVALIGAVADAGDFEWAEDLLRSEVAGQQMKAKAVASIVAARARAGDSATAFARAKQESDPAGRDAALDALARVVDSRGDVTMFEAVLDEIGDKAVVERCRAGSAASLYARDGRDAVEELIASLQDARAKAKASMDLALALVRDQRLPDAERVVADGQLGVSDAAITLATAVADAGDLDNAERLARQIRREERRDRCLGAIARSAASLGRFDRAEYFAREISKPEGTAVTLAAIARVSYRAGGQDRGLALAAAAEELYRSHAKQMRTSRALRAMAAALANVGDARRSWNLLKAITDQGHRDIAAQSVAPALVRGGLAADAELLLASLPANHRARSTRAALAVAYAEVGDRAKADELIQSLAGTPSGVVGLSHLAVYLASTGNLAEAVDMSRRAARQAGEFASGGAQDVLVSVAGALTSTGDADDALAVAHSAEGDNTRQAAIAEVACVLADAGEVGQAKALIQELREVQSADRVLVRLVRAATAAGDLPLAYNMLEQIQDDTSRAVARGAVVGLLGNARPELCDGLLREAANFARRSSDPARALADTAAAAYCTASQQAARCLLAEAFASGSWTSLLPALAQVDPATLKQLADAYVP